nr:hypothetical protein [Elizabethkingia sp. ASV34]
MKKLSRNELKFAVGAKRYDGGVYIGNDTGGDSGAEGGCFKCYSNNSDSCSECVYIRTKPVCSTGSYPVAC